MKPLSCLLLLLIALGSSLPAGAAPVVSNRAATIDEIGYLPVEGATAETNPPALAWLNEKDATSWTLQISRDVSFASPDVEIRDWPYLIYTHTAALEPGKYHWRYRYVTRKGKTSDWSRVRGFVITAEGKRFPRPSAEKLKEIMPALHPRMFTRPDKLTDLRKNAVAGNQQYEALLRAADGFLSSPIMLEPKPWSNGQWNADEWRVYLRESNAAVQAMENLAFAWLLSGNRAYGARAKEHLVAYVQWNPLGTSSMKVNDEVGMPMLYGLSRTYDWIYPLLSDDERKAARNHVAERAKETFDRLRKSPYEQFAYNSHSGRLWHYLGEAGLSLYGEVSEAEVWLNYAMTIFYGWYPAWGKEDGGWAEGMHYWASYNVLITWWLDLLVETLGIQAGDKPFYNNVGDFPLYVCPPGNPVCGFGDFSERPPATRSLAEPLDAFAALKGNGTWKWYVEATEAKLEGRFINYIRGNRTQPKAVIPRQKSILRLFPLSGIAAFNTDLTSAAGNLHLSMRSSPFGNVSHSHNDQNAIVMAAFGKPLLVNTGTRDFYGSAFCKEYYWQTLSHNSVLFDGKGQSRGRSNQGKFVAHGEEGDNLAYVVGDATSAYPGLVDFYRRWVIMLPETGVLMIDEVQTSASDMTMLFHGRKKFEHKAPRTKNLTFTFDDGDSHLPFTADFSLVNDDVRLVGRFVSLPEFNSEVTYTQTDKYPLPLASEKKPLFDEWHLQGKIPLSGDRGEVQRIVTLLTVDRIPSQESVFKLQSNAFTSGLAKTDEGMQITFDLAENGKKLTVRLEVNVKDMTVRRIEE